MERGRNGILRRFVRWTEVLLTVKVLLLPALTSFWQVLRRGHTGGSQTVLHDWVRGVGWADGFYSPAEADGLEKGITSGVPLPGNRLPDEEVNADPMAELEVPDWLPDSQQPTLLPEENQPPLPPEFSDELSEAPQPPPPLPETTPPPLPAGSPPPPPPSPPPPPLPSYTPPPPEPPQMSGQPPFPPGPPPANEITLYSPPPLLEDRPTGFRVHFIESPPHMDSNGILQPPPSSIPWATDEQQDHQGPRGPGYSYNAAVLLPPGTGPEVYQQPFVHTPRAPFPLHELLPPQPQPGGFATPTAPRVPAWSYPGLAGGGADLYTPSDHTPWQQLQAPHPLPSQQQGGALMPFPGLPDLNPGAFAYSNMQ